MEYLLFFVIGALVVLMVLLPPLKKALKNDARDPKTGKFIKLGK